jgi:hypothetical protein
MENEKSNSFVEVEQVIDVPWVYTLFRHGERYFLSVDCGSVALFTTDIELSPDEIARYSEQGKPSVEALAKAITYAPTAYSDRHIQTFFKWPKNR